MLISLHVAILSLGCFCPDSLQYLLLAGTKIQHALPVTGVRDLTLAAPCYTITVFNCPCTTTISSIHYLFGLRCLIATGCRFHIVLLPNPGDSAQVMWYERTTWGPRGEYCQASQPSSAKTYVREPLRALKFKSVQTYMSAKFEWKRHSKCPDKPNIAPAKLVDDNHFILNKYST